MISTYDFFMISWNDGVPNTDIEAYATTPAAVAKIYQEFLKSNSSVHKNIAGFGYVIQKRLGHVLTLNQDMQPKKAQQAGSKHERWKCSPSHP